MSTVNGFQVGSETLKYNYESLENYNTPEFSTTKTYAVGDYVIYQGKLYKCTTAVTTAGSWSSSNWALAVLSDDVSSLNNAISDITVEGTTPGYDEHDNILDGLTLTAGYYNNSNVYNYNTSFSYLVVDVSGISKIKIGGTHSVYTMSQFTQLGVFVDSSDAYVADIVTAYGSMPSNEPYEVNVPDGATKLRLNTDYVAASYPDTLPSGLYVYPWANIASYKVKNSALENEAVELNELSSSGKKVKIVAGAIRNDGNGWAFINDIYHEPLNLTAVRVNSNGYIEVDYSFTALKVLSLVVCPDETFSSKYSAGGSVGLDKTVITIDAIPQVIGGRVAIANGTVDITNSTFTSYTFNTTTGELRLYHSSLAGMVGKNVFCINAFSETYALHYGSQGFDYVSIYVLDNGVAIKDLTGLSFELWVNRPVPAAHVNANNIVDADGNFWIYGIMEI